MDNKGRNLELETWLIETTGEEMMANHLGPNWNRFNEEFGFYPNMSMTIADLVWQHQQSKVDELQVKFDQHDQWLGQRNRYVQELNDIIAKHVAEKDELQKRLDAVLEICNTWRSQCPKAVIEIERALKGEGNE
ncbi:hypothetical protein FY048_01530 [Acinetobacter sp. 1124_18A]|uniref:hypothetical protein n=1 Tax=Acinetobacter sp. 1124_18A TaxID=2605958 RepID=UPI004058C5AE